MEIWWVRGQRLPFLGQCCAFFQPINKVQKPPMMQPIAVGVPVDYNGQKIKVLNLFPAKLSSKHKDADALFAQIVAQNEIYDKVCQQFKELLGEDDFVTLNSAPFWNNPKSEEFRSQFINSPRPIIKKMAQERLKLWDLLSRYHSGISSIEEILRGMLEDSRPVGLLAVNVQPVVVRNSFQLSFSTWQISTGVMNQWTTHMISGIDINLAIQTNHIIEDDAAIREARIAKFVFERQSEFVDFLKTLKGNPEQPTQATLKLFLLPWNPQTGGLCGGLVSLYETAFARNNKILLNASEGAISNSSNNEAFGYQRQLACIHGLFEFVGALRTRNIHVQIHGSSSITITM